MGKRSNFERIERDYYPTPAAAVSPLLPHLPDLFCYWEPCAGDAALEMALYHATESGAFCGWMTDITPRSPLVSEMDAFENPDDILEDFDRADFIITNPPWDRKILHPMIVHFSDMRPTWLLFDADWIHTKQAAPYLPRLRKIVSVGRVKWIADSPHTGKENCAWHLFTKPSDDPCLFYGRSA